MTTEKLAEDLLTLWRILRSLSHPVRRAEMTPEQYWLLRILNVARDDASARTAALHVVETDA